jgi:hypothetical protein
MRRANLMHAPLHSHHGESTGIDLGRSLIGVDRLLALDRIARGILLLRDVRGFMQQHLVTSAAPAAGARFP